MEVVGEDEHDEGAGEGDEAVFDVTGGGGAVEARGAPANQQGEQRDDRHGDVVEVPAENAEPEAVRLPLDDGIEHPKYEEDRDASEVDAVLAVEATEIGGDSPEREGRTRDAHVDRTVSHPPELDVALRNRGNGRPRKGHGGDDEGEERDGDRATDDEDPALAG